jgi:hypothetical protein
MGRVYMYNVSWLFNRINARFNQRLIDVMPLEGLIPVNLNMYDDKNIIKAAKIYKIYIQYIRYPRSP